MMIAGVRILDGSITDALEAEALGLEFVKNFTIDIYSASWGPSDDGKTMEDMGSAAKNAMEKGTKEVSIMAEKL